MIVLKFGGTSVGSAEAIGSVVKIVCSRLDRKPVVVVSAFSKVTDALYSIAASSPDSSQEVAALEKRHFSVLDEVTAGAPASIREAPAERLKEVFSDLESHAAMASTNVNSKVAVISAGELLSSTVVWAALNAAGVRTKLVDARTMVFAQGDPLKGDAAVAAINAAVPRVLDAAWADDDPDALITQGFICSAVDRGPAILGRGGSDYSATLIGAAARAKAVEIWTDVDGVRTADPRRVGSTKCIRRISYEQAGELAYFGAKVLHPLTIVPAQSAGIPVYVLNTHNPGGENTVILPKEEVTDEVKSIAYKENVLLLELSPLYPCDSTHFFKKVFDSLSEFKVGIDLISTKSTGVKITVDPSARLLEDALERLHAFAKVELNRDVSQISAIGSSACGMSPILRHDFAPIGTGRIYMVSPGAAFVNISFVVPKSSLNEVLCATHHKIIENSKQVQ